jgi:hypothetical protein
MAQANIQNLTLYGDLLGDDNISISSSNGNVNQEFDTAATLDDTVIYHPLQDFIANEGKYVENPEYTLPLRNTRISTKDINIQTDKSDFINYSDKIYTDNIHFDNMSMSEAELLARREHEEAINEARRQELADQLKQDNMIRAQQSLNEDYRLHRQEREIDNRNLNISLNAQRDINQSILKTHESLLNIREKEIQEGLARDKSKRWSMLLSNIVKADGFLPEETERFVDDIDLTILTYGQGEKNELACYLATRASQGDLKRFIIEYIQESNTIRLQPGWEYIKDKILQSFVSRDLQEDHRRKLEMLRQSPGETLQSYIRRFSVLANKAYNVTTRPGEIDRLIMKCFIKSIYDKRIIERMYLHGDPPTTLKQAMVMSEKIQGCMQQLQSVGLGSSSSPKVEIAGLGDDDGLRDSREEIKKLKKENAQLKTQKAKDDAQLLTRIEQLERLQYASPTSRFRNEYRQEGSGHGGGFNRQREQDQRGPPSNLQFGSFQRTWNAGIPVCDFCGREGHIHSRCWEKHPEQRGQRYGKGNYRQTDRQTASQKEPTKDTIQRDQTGQEN